MTNLRYVRKDIRGIFSALIPAIWCTWPQKMGILDKYNFLNRSVSQQILHSGNTWPTLKVSWTKRSGRWATRPATPSTPHWMQLLARRTVTASRIRSSQRIANWTMGCSSAASGEIKHFATSAGFEPSWRKYRKRSIVQVLLHTFDMHLSHNLWSQERLWSGPNAPKFSVL